MNIQRLLIAALGVIATKYAIAQKGTELSHTFELRYVTNDVKANGETDFKGPTEYLTTEQRVDYLNKWANHATVFFNDKNLDELAVSEKEVDETLTRIKPQPLPEVRQTIRLEEWKWTARKDENVKDNKTTQQRLLQLHEKGYADFENQTWRFRIEADIEGKGSLTLNKGNEIACKYDNDGKNHHLVIEADLQEDIRCYNIKADGKSIVDFKPLLTHQGGIDRICINGKDIKIDNIWGVGYTKTTDTRRLNQPMFAHTFIDLTSKSQPKTQGWTTTTYDDTAWETCILPKNHGTERHEGEDLLLRKRVTVGDYEKAYFEMESLFPSGELWINGKVVEVMKDAHRKWIDVTKYLQPGRENLIAVKIDAFKADFKQMMHHCPTDPNIGWFAGRTSLHLTKATRVSDVYVYTNDIKGNDADVTAEVTIENTDYKFFSGSLMLMLSEWFPDQKDEKTAFSMDIDMKPQETKTFKLRFTVKNAKLWTYYKPQLYKVRALLTNHKSGKRIETYAAVDGDLARSREIIVDKLTDDMVVTTGFRTIDQEGGTFRINRKPELLRAPLYFGQRFPLETNAQNILSPSNRDIVRELIAVKKMNGNGMRMSAHWSDDNTQDGTNDPRFAEIADQLGLMFIWQTASWIRLRSPLVADFKGMANDVRQVRNAPSIVIWQPSNHPSLTKWPEVLAYWHLVYDAIYPNDTTRLITPTADFRHTIVYNDDGTRNNSRKPVNQCDTIWTANRIARGSMDYPTGFGQNWQYLREWPFPHKWKGNADIYSFLKSKERAYFNFEQEESIGQMNWHLFRGTPVYKFHSYEWEYDKGSIGRLLTCDEWMESQAWQAFSAYESIRKMRWLDYDGLSWCCMWGGGNMGTYQKPLVDALGHKKLSYYAHRMGFQQTIAGSGNVDIVYGPDDHPSIIVMNIGEKRLVDVFLTIYNEKGKQVARKKYRNIILPAGRSTINIGNITLPQMEKGFYFFDYTVIEQQ